MALRRVPSSSSEPQPVAPAADAELAGEDQLPAEALDAEEELPLGVEPWSGSEMPQGTASSHDLHAPLDDADGGDAGAESSELELLHDAGELNYRRIYETRFKPLDSGAREECARRVTDSELFALTLDPTPGVIAALLDNPQFGLA